MRKPGRPKTKSHARHFLGEWRELRGLTQAELAAQLGEKKDHSQISKIERGSGNITEPMIYKVCEVLRIEPGWLWSPPAQIEQIQAAQRRTAEEQAWVDLLRSLSEEDRRHVLESAKALRFRAEALSRVPDEIPRP